VRVPAPISIQCSGGPICNLCSTTGESCVYDQVDGRRQRLKKNETDTLLIQQNVLQGLLRAIREGEEGPLINQIKQGASIDDLAHAIESGTRASLAIEQTQRTASAAGETYAQYESGSMNHRASESRIHKASSRSKCGTFQDGCLLSLPLLQAIVPTSTVQLHECRQYQRPRTIQLMTQKEASRRSNGNGNGNTNEGLSATRVQGIHVPLEISL
jgi:hypothetical protein